MAIILDEPTTLETFLHYGLFLGAIFQIACIFAVIFIPYSENEEVSTAEQLSSTRISTWHETDVNEIEQNLPVASREFESRFSFRDTDIKSSLVSGT